MGVIAIATRFGLAVMAASQRTEPPPTGEPARFDAASIKPSKVAAIVGYGFRVSDGRLLAVNTTVEDRF